MTRRKHKTHPGRVHRHLKLQSHRHTGRRLPHGQTSYPGLLVLLLLVGSFLGFGALTTRAATITQTGNISVGATVPGPPPATAPTIDAPVSGQVFSTIPITVTGSCIPNLIVKLTRNGAFSGSAACNGAGRFTIQSDLYLGDNELIAKNFDNLDQGSPDSNTVIVKYQPPTPVTPAPAAPQTPSSPNVMTTMPVPPVKPSDQILLQTDYLFRGIKPASKFVWDLKLSGGTPPYALAVDWGDGTQMVKTVAQPSTVRLEHSYSRAGSFIIEVRTSDAVGRTSFLQFAAVVDGYVPTALGTIDGGSNEGQFLVRLLNIMPYYWAATALVTAFWLGSTLASRGGLAGISLRPRRRS